MFDGPVVRVLHQTDAVNGRANWRLTPSVAMPAQPLSGDQSSDAPLSSRVAGSRASVCLFAMGELPGSNCSGHPCAVFLWFGAAAGSAWPAVLPIRAMRSHTRLVGHPHYDTLTECADQGRAKIAVPSIEQLSAPTLPRGHNGHVTLMSFAPKETHYV